MKHHVTSECFGVLPDGRHVTRYTMTNDAGLSASILDYGATLQSLFVPDRDGAMSDIVCGFDTIEGYCKSDGYYGAVIGRVCNRIGGASFTLDGVSYRVSANEGPNQLHGGFSGLDKTIWQVSIHQGEEPSLTFSAILEDGQDGYPGRLTVQVTYTLRDKALAIHYEATTDKKTLVNLTNHTYFNLRGYAHGDLSDHYFQLDADRYLEGGEGLIPTGAILSVESTPFDCRVPMRFASQLDLTHPHIASAGGYDHHLLFVKREGEALPLRAVVTEPVTGRVLKLFTDQPGMQFYSGNFINDKALFKGNVQPCVRGAFCLETQKTPDAIHHVGFDDVTLDVGDTYTHTTVWAFETK